MTHRDPRVGAYIARAAPFARPILRALRELAHEACPAATETIKWGIPFFEHHGQLCFMAAFKAHAAFGIPRGSRALTRGGAMGVLGRITSLDDLPPKRKLLQAVREAAARNEAGKKPARRVRPAPRLPDDLAAALGRSARAKRCFAAFTPAQQREYVTWITEAKRAATRAARITTAVAWIAVGKRRNWKYAR